MAVTNRYSPNDEERKFKQIINELLRKRKDPNYVRFAMDREGYDLDVVDQELNKIMGFEEQKPTAMEGQIEVGGRTFAPQTYAEAQSYTKNKEEAQALKATAEEDLNFKLKRLEEAISDKKGLKRAVGPGILGRGVKLGNIYTDPDRTGFVGTVQQIIDTDALDSLIKAKARGATFGALSDTEMAILKSSATKLGNWQIIDPETGQVSGYNASEEDFMEELNTLKKLTQKALGKLNQETAEDGTGEQPVAGQGTLSENDKARQWLQANPDDPRAEQVRQVLEKTAETTMQTETEIPQTETTEEDSIFGDFREGFESLVGRAEERADKVGAMQKSGANVFEKAKYIFGQGAGLGADVIGEGVIATGKALLSQEQEDAVKKAFTGTVNRVLEMESVQGMTEAYERLKETNPEAARDLETVLNIADLATSFTGAGIGIKESGKLMSKTALKASQASGKVATGTAKAGGTVGKYGVAQMTGFAPETVEQIIKNPDLFTAKEMEQVTKESVFRKVKESLGAKIDNFSELGKAYDPIRNSGDFVNISPDFVESQLKKYGLGVVDGKVQASTKSLTRETSDINAIQKFYDNWADKRTLEADEFLNMRADLAGLAKFDKISGKTSASETIGKGLRKSLNENYRKDIAGLEDLDNQFSKEVSELKDLKKVIFNRDGSIKDNATSTIAKLTGEGKEQKLQRIKELVPGIEQDVNILKAVKDIQTADGRVIGSYTRGGVIAGSTLSGNLPVAFATYILTTPKVATGILRQYGKLKGITEGIIENVVRKMESGAELLKKEKEVVEDALQNASKKFDDRAKKIIGDRDAGLSLSEVSPAVRELQRQQQKAIKAYREATTETIKKRHEKNIKSLDDRIAEELKKD